MIGLRLFSGPSPSVTKLCIQGTRRGRDRSCSDKSEQFGGLMAVPPFSPPHHVLSRQYQGNGKHFRRQDKVTKCDGFENVGAPFLRKLIVPPEASLPYVHQSIVKERAGPCASCLQAAHEQEALSREKAVPRGQDSIMLI